MQPSFFDQMGMGTGFVVVVGEMEEGREDGIDSNDGLSAMRESYHVTSRLSWMFRLP